jgi:DNA polymerase I
MRMLTSLPTKDVDEALAFLLQPRHHIAIDIETVSLDNMLPLGIAVAVSKDVGYYFFNPKDEVLKKVVAQTPDIIAFNASFDIPLLRSMGYQVNDYDDAMLLAYSCGILDKSLEKLSQSMLHAPYTSVTSQWKKSDQGNIGIDHVKMAGWSLQHALNTLNLWDMLPKTQLYREIDRPCIDLVIEMEQHGVLVDQYRLTLVEQETMTKVLKIEEEIKAELGDINLASNPQVVKALQAKGILGTRKTKAGKDSVSDESLKPLHNPLTDKILKYRSLMKTISTYVPAFRNVDHIGRLHTSYGYTDTGRWNSSAPNLQNLTRDEKFEDD